MNCSPLLAKQYFPCDRRSQIKTGNLYTLCYQAQEDVPGEDPLRVEFKYTVRGRGIITYNCEWSGLGGGGGGGGGREN